jgi:hypothetical protein
MGINRHPVPVDPMAGIRHRDSIHEQTGNHVRGVVIHETSIVFRREHFSAF